MLHRMTDRTLAEQLLDAQVAYVLEQLTGDQLKASVAQDVDELLAIAAGLSLESLVDKEEVKPILRRLVATIPPTTGATEIVQSAVDVVYAGPEEPYSASELISREHVELLVDEALAAQPVLKGILDGVAESPLVATVASRFVSRIVGEVLATNKAVAEKIPGVGSLMSFGAGAASKVMGAGTSGFEQLLGDTAGKGATFAVRRLNKIILETMSDPTTRAAVLQVWDLYADQPVGQLGKHAEKDDLYRIVGIVKDLVSEAAATEQAGELVDALVDSFFARYGKYPAKALLDELEIGREHLVADIGVIAGRVIETANQDGAVERLIRARLEPFFKSPEVEAILGDQGAL